IGSVPPDEGGVGRESRFVVDPVLARVFEFRDESDNISAAALPVILSPAPDLQVTTVTIPEHAQVAQSFDLHYTVSNLGDSATRANQPRWDDLVYLSRDPLLDLNADLFLGQIEHIGPLDAGFSYDVTQSMKLPRGLTGSFFVFVVTDPVRTVTKPHGAVFE